MGRAATGERADSEVVTNGMTRLTKAAAAEFALFGMSAASLEAIAKRAGLTRQYIYKLFGGKQKLYRTIRTRAEETLLDRMSAVDYRSLPPLPAIKAFVEHLYDAHHACPELGSMFGDQILHGTDLFERDDRHTRAFEALRSSLSDVLDEGRRKGVVRRDWDGPSLYFLVAVLVIAVVADGDKALVDRDWIIRFVTRSLTTQRVALPPIRPVHPVEHVDHNAVDRILTTAEKAFATAALDHIPIQQLATGAGVSSQLIFHYFDSKAELFRAMQDRLVARCMAPFEAIDWEGTAPIEAVRDYAVQFWSEQAANPAMRDLAMTLRLHHGGYDAGDATMRHRRARLIERMNLCLSGSAAGRVDADIDGRRLYFVTLIILAAAGALTGPDLSGAPARTYIPLALNKDHLFDFIVQGSVAA